MAPKPAAAPEALAVVDGLSFAAWIEREGLSRSSAYKYAAELGIRRPQRHNPTAGRAEPWLAQADAEALTTYTRALREGAKHAEALALIGRGSLVAAGHVADPRNPAESAEGPSDREGVELLALRLRALRDAVELGAPLSRSDAAALLGVVPGAGVGESVTRAGIEARHLARGVWQLRKAEAGRGRW